MALNVTLTLEEPNGARTSVRFKLNEEAESEDCEHCPAEIPPSAGMAIVWSAGDSAVLTFCPACAGELVIGGKVTGVEAENE